MLDSRTVLEPVYKFLGIIISEKEHSYNSFLLKNLSGRQGYGLINAQLTACDESNSFVICRLAVAR